MGSGRCSGSRRAQRWRVKLRPDPLPSTRIAPSYCWSRLIAARARISGHTPAAGCLARGEPPIAHTGQAISKAVARVCSIRGAVLVVPLPGTASGAGPESTTLCAAERVLTPAAARTAVQQARSACSACVCTSRQHLLEMRSSQQNNQPHEVMHHH